MNRAIESGLSFGLTSGVITTLGLVVGIQSSTQSKIAVIGAILTIAVADAFSDALAMHFSDEAQTIFSPAAVWQASISTFIFKMLSAISFIVPVLFFPLEPAVIISIIYGLALIGFLTIITAKQQHEEIFMAVIKHLSVAVLVILLSHYIGLFIANYFRG